MNSHTIYLIYGPFASLIRISEKLFIDHPPKFLHSRSFNAIQTKLDVAVYEEYDKQINSSITLTCIFETTPQHNKILLKKTGGRMGFRGSEINGQHSLEKIVTDYIFDYSKRFGLTVQEERVSDVNEKD